MTRVWLSGTVSESPIRDWILPLTVAPSELQVSVEKV